ncbi:MAG: M3 family oligoendopeptidase [Alphaproteobacteria bacterium]
MEKGKLKVKAPTWNLDDLYKGVKDPAIEKDLAALKASIDTFVEKYESKVTTLDSQALALSIQDYESLSERMGRLSSFASLIFAQDMTHKEKASFYQNIQEKITDLSTPLIFYTLEFNQIADSTLKSYYSESPLLSRYKPWIENVRIFKKHQLNKDLEHVFHELSLPASRNWVRLYDETFATMTFQYEGKDLSIAQIMNFFTSANEEERQRSAEAFGARLKKSAPLFTLILNTLAKEKQIEDKWRQYARPVSSRNLANNVEDEVVKTLLQSVQSKYPSLSHRYYKLKAKWLGKDKLNYWDRNAPLPQDTQKKYSWDEAQEIVLAAYHQFCPKMAAIGKEFFDKNWIDAEVRPGKDNGAFSHPTVPSAHPYILQNYQGKIWDVMTLAHELGHGIHQVLSAKQGYLMADTPLTLAETASIFGEMLTFQILLNQAKSKEEKKILLAGKVGDMLNSIVRQISFSQFEHEFHDIRKSKELSTEEINDLWLKTQQESLGPSVVLKDNYAYYWTYISHFFHVPFYVYAYAFGNCLVNSLYATYQNKLPAFQEKYFSMLEAGGTLHHTELLSPFSLNAKDPHFWHQGLDLVSEWIDELEDLS